MREVMTIVGRACHHATPCCLLLLCLISNASLADQNLTPHRATYKVKISLLSGEMQSGLQIDGSDYVVESTVTPKGIARLITRGTIRESSRFNIVQGEVRPSEYRSADTLSKNGNQIQINFDWTANAAVGVVDGSPYSAPLDVDVIDRASLQYALMFDLLNQQLREEYVLLEADGTKRLTVSNRGEKSVRVPFGLLDVIGITHRAESSSRETTLWCAPSLGYLPVVIEQHKDGKPLGTIVLVDYEDSSAAPLAELRKPNQ